MIKRIIDNLIIALIVIFCADIVFGGELSRAFKVSVEYLSSPPAIEQVSLPGNDSDQKTRRQIFSRVKKANPSFDHIENKVTLTAAANGIVGTGKPSLGKTGVSRYQRQPQSNNRGNLKANSDGGTGVPRLVRGGGTGGTGGPVVADNGIGGTGGPVVADNGIGGTGGPVVADNGIGGTGGPVVADNNDPGDTNTPNDSEDPGNTDFAGGGGIGGSGSPSTISLGTITGFGSIFVNGVEFFFADDAKIKLENVDVLDSDLKLGMVVKVEGEIDANGTTGTATKVESGYVVKGAIEDTPLADVDNLTKTFTILGSTVIVDRSSTVFHPLPGSVSFDFDTISKCNYIRLSGYFNNQGVIIATHVEELGQYDEGVSKVIVGGIVTDYNGVDQFTLGSQLITINNMTEIIASDSGLNEIKDNGNVKVNGIKGDNNTIKADVVNIIEIANQTADKWIIEGIISDLDAANQTFELDDNFFDYSGLGISSLSFDLENDLHVEVTATKPNDTWVVESILARGGNVEIDGVVIQNDLLNKTIIVEVADGQPIPVYHSIRTLLEVEGADSGNDTVSAILVGDFVRIKAVDNMDGSVDASLIKSEPLKDEAKYRIVGSVSSIEPTAYELTILNTTFSISDASEFDGETLDDFFRLLQISDTLSVFDFRINGQIYGDGVVEKVEIK